MLEFLIARPIAVTMSILTMVILSLVAFNKIPVSLMPEIDIPRITVQFSARNTSARTLQEMIVEPVRRSVLGLNHVSDVQFESKDESCLVKLEFDYGTDIDLAFIEVNETINRVMAELPREIQRPKIIKASVTDIPVFYINIGLKEQRVYTTTSPTLQEQSEKPDERFLELSEFSTRVIRRRVEQVPEVAMVDISGIAKKELQIVPDIHQLASLNMSLSELEQHVRENDIDLGNLLINEGQYQYNVRFSSKLKNKNDIENILIRNNQRVIQLKQLATVLEQAVDPRGLVISDGKPIVTFAVIKQSDAQMSSLEQQLDILIANFHQEYPELKIWITRDQTKLLKYSIDSVTQNLIVGAILVMVVMLLFFDGSKLPVLISITIFLSMLFSLLAFYWLKLSINIISLSGLALASGMIVDNGIIIVDNIKQIHHATGNVLRASVDGTRQVAGSMFISSLTNCIVFLPLVFLSGITGELFYEEAMAITLATFCSLVVTLLIIPVYYYQLHLSPKAQLSISQVRETWPIRLYHKSFKWGLRNPLYLCMFFIAVTTAGIIVYPKLPKSQMPQFTKDEFIVEIDWNEKLSLTENLRRVSEICRGQQALLVDHTSYIGEQQFLLSEANMMDGTNAAIYFKLRRSDDMSEAKKSMMEKTKVKYPNAIVNFRDDENIFNWIFGKEKASLVIKLTRGRKSTNSYNTELKNYLSEITHLFPAGVVQPAPWREQMVLNLDPLKMALLDVRFEDVFGRLKAAFNDNVILKISDDHELISVLLGGKKSDMTKIFNESYVVGKSGVSYPIRNFLSVSHEEDLRVIKSGKDGEYYPVELWLDDQEVAAAMAKFRQKPTNESYFQVDFDGSFFLNRILLRELTVVMIVSIALLYFLLAAQFESLTLPAIILVEIPLSIAGGMTSLYLMGQSLNIMSMVGFIVMGGVIINDSILKIDTINMMIREGKSPMKAVILAGKKRFNAILMTTLTAILGVVPVLFSSGLSAEIQAPLAVTLTSGLILGTIASLYLLPLMYYHIYVRVKK